MKVNYINTFVLLLIRIIFKILIIFKNNTNNFYKNVN